MREYSLDQKQLFIVLTDTGSVLTRAIKFFTKAPYNHVSISLDPSFKTLYSFGRKKPRNPFMGGFVQESFNEGTYKRFEDTSCLVLKMDIDADIYDKLEENVGIFVENMDRYHYNFIGLFGAAIGKQISRRNGYYCSHFVAKVMEDADLKLWDTPSFLVTPEDFQHHDEFKVVYEGLMREFI